MVKIKDKFDPSKISIQTGTVYYGNNRATPKQIKLYQQYLGEDIKTSKKNISTRIRVPHRFAKYFPEGSLISKTGWTHDWAKSMAIHGGKNPEYNYSRTRYFTMSRKGDGVWQKTLNAKLTNSRKLYGAVMGKSKAALKGYVLNGFTEFAVHFGMAEYAIMKQAEMFRIAVGYRALQVFKTSFKKHQMYASGSSPWAPLKQSTLKKRSKRRTGSSILVEYKDLMNSLEVREGRFSDIKTLGSIGSTIVTTNPVKANKNHHKKNTICYAGFHNDPRPQDRYGSHGGHYIKRQFMGFSDHIDTFAFSIMSRYLFHSVFLAAKK